jgi:hypothetical protein
MGKLKNNGCRSHTGWSAEEREKKWVSAAAVSGNGTGRSVE